jgi:hypothetical protein
VASKEMTVFFKKFINKYRKLSEKNHNVGKNERYADTLPSKYGTGGMPMFQNEKIDGLEAEHPDSTGNQGKDA